MALWYYKVPTVGICSKLTLSLSVTCKLPLVLSCQRLSPLQLLSFPKLANQISFAEESVLVLSLTRTVVHR